MTARNFSISAFTLLLGLSLSLPGSAQSPSQQRWLAWQGCWSAEGAPADELLCIVPEGKGIRMITIQRGAVVAESVVSTDSTARAVRYNDCSGTELAYWSSDHRRVFLKSDLTCANGVKRNASGMFVFVGLTQWLSVQAVTTGDQTATALVRYTAVEPKDVPVAIANALSGRAGSSAARAVASAAPDEDAVTEAVRSIDASAVEEWLRVINRSSQLGDNFATVDGGAASTSALEMTSRSEVVHVIPVPIYVHKTYLFGGRYFGRYSPWGYDWWGWRLVNAPIVYVRGGHSVGSRTRFGRYYAPHIIRHDRDWDHRWRGGSATHTGYTRGRDAWRSESGGRGDRSGRSGGSRESRSPRQASGPARQR